MGKGGARHAPKPHVDPGLLHTVFNNHLSLVRDFGSYEKVSKQQASHPQGLMHMLPLLKGLVDLEPLAEIHGNDIRQGLFNTLLKEPSLNNTQFNGQTWVSLKAERLTVVLFHLRRLATQEDYRTLASKLNGNDFLQLKELITKVQKKSIAQAPMPALCDQAEAPMAALCDQATGTEASSSRVLKKEVSDVSLDSNGLPNCLNSPVAQGDPLLKGDSPVSQTDPLLKGECAAVALPQPSFKRKRKGQRSESHQAAPEAKTSDRSTKLRNSLGLGAVYKKPGTALKKKKKKKPSAAPLLKAKKASAAPLLKGARQRWTKLRVTQTHKPPFRSYITGTTSENGRGPLVLIVETTMKNHPKYKEILAEIKRKLEEEHITKQEAVVLRDHLYWTW